jgi:cobalt/nickel transport system permease protein
LDIGIIDYLANSGKSFFHRASPACKMVFVLLFVLSIMITGDLVVLISIYITLLTLSLLTDLPFLRVVSIASYPAIFAMLFAIASWNGDPVRSGVIVFKALGAALTMVILILTTPYHRIFSCIRPFLPQVVVDGLFLTYRALFILLELMDNFIRALKIRGGLSPRSYRKNLRNFAQGIGLLLVRGFDLAERFYCVMRVRGYSGRLGNELIERKFIWSDIFIFIITLCVCSLSFVVRFRDDFNRFSLYFLYFSLFVFVVSGFYHIGKVLGVRGVLWKS